MPARLLASYIVNFIAILVVTEQLLLVAAIRIFDYGWGS